MRELLSHQHQAIEYLNANHGGALFMQMRLGKTLVCIRYLQKKYGPNKSKILVVAPVVGLWAWQRELRLEGETSVLLTGSREQRIRKLWESGRGGWFLINYEGLRSIYDKLILGNWDAIILDESRAVANPKAKTSKALLNFVRKGEERIVLSGEPAPESPLEYFNQLAFVGTPVFGASSYWQFRHNFFHELAPHEWVLRTNAVDRFKNELHRRAFFMTRKQAGIPDRKIYEVRALQMPGNLRKVYEEVKRDFVAKLPDRTVSTKWVPVQYMWLHQLASGFLGEKYVWEGKVRQLLELLQGELRKEQVVVWFRFNPGLEQVSKELKTKGVAHGRVVGTMSRSDREAAINQFREGDLRVLLCQVKCAKAAIDLSNSSTAIYFSNSYALEERLQSEDRILNPLKREPLLYLDLITQGTVEEDIVEILEEKSSDSRFFMNRLIQKLKEAA